MCKNYLLVAFRGLTRNPVFSVINILGLSAGLTCSLFILLWVRHERSVDAFHNPRLFVVYEREYDNHEVTGDYETSALLANELRKTIPEVEEATSLGEYDDQSTFKVGDRTLKWKGRPAGKSFFRMFHYPLLEGTSATALQGPKGIALSHRMATYFFGSPQAALGKTIRYENRRDFQVTGVFEDLPENASKHFDYLINWDAFLEEAQGLNNWGSSGPATYVMLRPNTDPVLVDQKLRYFLKRFAKEQPSPIELGIQPFSEAYLHDHFTNGFINGGRIEYINLFSIVAAIILLIACINFMNLATARSVKRAKEIGVRKAIGAFRSSLILQFLTESLLLTVLAVGLALGLAVLFLPLFDTLTQKNLVLPFGQPAFWMQVLLITFLTGVIAGSYPALYLSSFHPVSVLKGKLTTRLSAIWFRKGLVIVQFSLSVLLIIGTIVVARQVHFILSRNMGYNRANLLYVPMEGDLAKSYTAFRDEAILMPGIRSVSFVSDDPMYMDNNSSAILWDGKSPKDDLQVEQAYAGFGFTTTMGLTIIKGRDYSREFPMDTPGYLINQSMAARTGYPDPIGRYLSLWGRRAPIIGVINDFNFKSIKEKIRPMVLQYGVPGYGTILIRIEPGQTVRALSSLETLCKRYNPAFPFSYRFSDQAYQQQYENERVTGRLADAFAFLAILISSLGLLGLAIFTAEQRTKEIGIRKVLGASVRSLVVLLSGEFLTLVCVALLVASPIAWYIMNRWLDQYAYRTGIAWWVFPMAGILALGVALMTIGFHSVRAALANPVKSLKTE